ncbi:hydroxymethylbilane synthase [Sphingomicrobium sp. XHP0235]|uniref:hydroxymethylbilane synthase n=1 Tax=Sphingomicrobium aquimarinum TaxID=3133971 RepID=UPI0031FF0F32
MTLRIGTRGSPLALIQAEMVKSALLAAHGWAPEQVEIVTISTRGDRNRTAPLTEMGGKAVWTKELDRALLAGDTQISVNSMKDVESERPDGVRIAATLPREDVRDCLIGAESLDDLKQGAIIGTASPRRAAQVRSLRPDLQTTLLRGNVATRLAAVGEGKVDATLLAMAGLNRLGMSDKGAPVSTDTLLPAPSQGAIGIDCRADDEETAALLAGIDDAPTSAAIALERAFTAALGGDCHSPVAAHASPDGDGFDFKAELYSEDGSERICERRALSRGATGDAADLARAMLAGAPSSIAGLFDA